MYLRYFMWNFAGRQNDIQGRGELEHGNWISGIGFIDDARLGPQDKLPDHLKNNAGNNKYYFLPLILGIIGLVFQYKNQNKDFWVVTLLFLFTGLAIVAYLNQYPLQPRERDYAYAGSFYAFAIWIGLGVMGLVNSVSKNYKSVAAIGGIGVLSLILVPGLMAAENWDDHDRSGRYTARDFAYNYLNSCDENAIIFTNGDNDTFPLWYLQEVEGIRTDVRVINLSYFTADWYISQMATRMYESDPVSFGMNRLEYRNGTRDMVFFADNALIMLNEKYEANKAFFENEYAELYGNLLEIVSDSKLPRLAPKDYQELQKGHQLVNFESFANAVGKIARKASDLGIDSDRLQELITGIESLAKRIDQAHLPLDDAMNFILSDDPRFKEGRYFLPGRKFVIKIDTAAIAEKGILNESQLNNMVDEIRFQISGRRALPKNNLMMLDLINQISQDNWERPIYYALTGSRENLMNLEPFLHREGLAYRILPSRGSNNDLFAGTVDTEKMYENLMNKFRWGSIDDPDVYLDENNQRMISNFRYAFAALSNALLEEGKKDSAIQVLDRCMEIMPNERVPFNAAIIPVIQIYYNLDAMEKANAISRTFAGMMDQSLSYYEELQRSKPGKFGLSMNDYQMASRNLMSLYSLANSFEQADLGQELLEKISIHDATIRNAFPMQ